MAIIHGGTSTTVNGGKKVTTVTNYGKGHDGKPNTSANPEERIVDAHGKVEYKRSKDIKKD